ncbi:MAG: choice-of-anchor D domain-containing protein [Salinivirgaceae bacterium]|nr:choice-of-anchor D domain-containing protein [Salinivirgaceae bacterium]
MRKVEFTKTWIFLLLALFASNISFGQLNEDFSAGIPANWEIRDIDGDGSFTAPASELFGRTEYAGGDNLGDDYLISPKVTVTASDKTLSFDHMTTDYDYDYNELQVYIVSTIPSDNNYSGETAIFDEYLGEYNWTTTTLDLNTYIGKDVYIVFHIKNDYGATNYGGIDNVNGPAIAVTNAPKIELTALVFSTIIEGASTTANLTIKNTGTAVLSISGFTVDAPFSTTVTTLSIVQGTQEDVEFTFAPTAAGDFTKELTVNIDGAFDGINKIELKASATAKKPKIELSVSAFSTITEGSSTKANLTIKNTGEADLSISGFTIDAPFSTTATTLTIAKGTQQDVEFTFAPTTVGDFTKDLTINIDGEFEGTNTIQFSAAAIEKKPAIELSIASFDNIDTGSSTKANLTIKNTGEADLKITGFTIDAPFSTTATTLTITKGTQQDIEFVFTPTVAGDFSKELTVTIDGNYDGDNTISLSGKASEPKVPTITLTAPVFDNVPPGSNTTKNLTIKNTGDGVLNITGIAIAAPFSTTATTLTIEPGSEESIALTFAPVVEGNFSETLTATINGDFNGDNEIQINGSSTKLKPTIELIVADFAPVVLGETSKANLEIKNTGDADLNITGFTIPAPFSSTATTLTLAKGTQQIIEIIFTPTIAGNFAETLTVNIDGDFTGVNEIQLQGTAAEPATPNITLIAPIYENVPPDLNATKNIIIKNTGDGVLNITGITIAAPFSCSVTTLSIAKNTQKEVEITFAPTTEGEFSETLTVAIDGDYSGDNEILINASSTKLKPTVELIVADFSSVVLGNTNTANLQIRNTGEANLNITGITVAAPFSTSAETLTIAPGNQQDIDITFTPITAGDFSEILTVNIDDQYEGDNTIILTATATEPPLPNIELTALEFDNLAPGSNTTKNFTIKNTGKGILNIIDFTLAAPFSTTANALIIDAGEQQDIEITYAPSSEGDFSEILTVNIDGDFEGSNKISISGISIEPKPTIEFSMGNFTPVLVGSNSVAVLSIKNTGDAELDITAINIANPFSCVATTLKIATGAQADVEISFAPTSNGIFNETLSLNINGNYNGENTINLTGITYIPDVLFEDFESSAFPPNGWTVKHNGSEYYGWRKGTIASSAYEGVSYSYAGPDGGSLASPQLNIKSGDELSFYVHNSSASNGTLSIKYSDDNNIWNNLEDITLTDSYEKITVDLSSITGEKYIGFFGENYVFIDNVSGPEMLTSGTPNPATNPTPIHQAQGLYNTIELSWDASLCADGYKLCLGTSENPVAILDHVNTGITTSYTVRALDFATNFKWKVIPYNNGVDAVNCPEWTFTTMADPTIKNFPYTQGFEEDEQNPGWIINNWYSGAEPYTGLLCARTLPIDTNAILMTAPIELPSNYCIHFYWKDDDISAPSKNAKISGHDSTFFEVSIDYGINWTVLRTLSPEIAMSEYQREIVDLSEYAEKTILLRWHYKSDGNVQKAYGTGVDAISIQARPLIPVPELNLTSWDAGVVDFGETINSENIFEIINVGVGTLNITSAILNNNEFTTSFVIDDVALAENETYKFAFNYEPSDAGVDNTTFTIVCSSGETFIINLTGKAHAENYTIWDIEEMDDFSVTPIPWRTINADNLPTWGWSDFDFPHEGDSLAFIVFNPGAINAEGFEPHSKNKFLASIAAKGNTTDPVSSNDWLISPQGLLGENPEFSFWAKSSTDQSGLLEKFNVAISTTGHNVDDFIIISGTTTPLEAPADKWTKYNFDLSQYKGENVYVAIQCVSFNNFIFMVDDLCLYDFTELNTAPVFTSEAIVTAHENKNYSYSISAIDDNFDAITFSAEELPSWLNLTDNNDGTALLAGIPLSANIGANTIKLIASDSKTTTEQLFTINVEEFANIAPIFTSDPVSTGRKGINYIYTITVSDEDNDDLTISSTATLPSWLTLTALGGNTETLSGTPTTTGDFDIELTLSDGFTTTNQSFTIIVGEPEFDKPLDLTATIANNNNVELQWVNPTGIRLEEGFEEETWPPLNWNVKYSKTIDGELEEPKEGEEAWFHTDENSYGSPAHPEIIHSGLYAAGIEYSAPDFNWLISPNINVKDNEELSFWLYYINGDYQGTYYYTNFHVLVNKDNAWEEVLFLTDGDEINNYNSELKVDLSAYANQSIQIAFVYEFNNSYQLFLDDVKVAAKQDETKSFENNLSKGDGTLSGYKVYRNDESIADISNKYQVSFTDENLENGDYTYHVVALYSNPDGLSEASNNVTLTVNQIGIIDNTVNNTITVYPNPNNGQFTIHTDAEITGNTIVKIFDISGKIIYTNTFTSFNKCFNNQINLNDCTKGIYNLQVINENNVYSQKLIIK